MDLADYFVFEYEAGVEEGFVVGHQLSFYALPHVIGLWVVVVAIQDVPALHESCIFGQHCILHVLEVVLGHLIVHLVLEMFQIYIDLPLFIVLFQFAE